MATILPEVSIDGVGLSETEMINLEKSFVNMLREILNSVTSGIFSYQLGTKRVDRTLAINYLLNGIDKIRIWRSKLPKVEHIGWDYDVSEYGEDNSEYIGDIEST